MEYDKHICLPCDFFAVVGLRLAPNLVLFLAHCPEVHWLSARPDGRFLDSLASASASASAAAATLHPTAVATSAFPSTPAFVAPASVAPSVFASAAASAVTTATVTTATVTAAVVTSPSLATAVSTAPLAIFTAVIAAPASSGAVSSAAAAACEDKELREACCASRTFAALERGGRLQLEEAEVRALRTTKALSLREWRCRESIEALRCESVEEVPSPPPSPTPTSTDDEEDEEEAIRQAQRVVKRASSTSSASAPAAAAVAAAAAPFDADAALLDADADGKRPRVGSWGCTPPQHCAPDPNAAAASSCCSDLPSLLPRSVLPSASAAGVQAGVVLTSSELKRLQAVKLRIDTELNGGLAAHPFHVRPPPPFPGAPPPSPPFPGALSSIANAMLSGALLGRSSKRARRASCSVASAMASRYPLERTSRSSTTSGIST